MGILILTWGSMSGCVSPDERRRATVDRAEEMLSMGDSQRALQVLEGFLSYDPRDMSILARMAKIHLDEGRPRRALAVLQSAPGDVDPASAGIDLWLRTLIANGRLNRAGAILIRLESEGEASPELLRDYWLHAALQGVPAGLDLPTDWRLPIAEEQLRHKMPSEALETLRHASEDLSDDAEWRELMEVVIRQILDLGDDRLLRRVEEIHRPPVSPWKLLARHHLLQLDGRYGEAGELEELFLASYADHPRRYRMLLSAARREIRSGRGESGLQRSREAASLQPTRAEPLVEQALALRLLGRAGEAEQTLEMALGLEPNHGAARRLLERLDRRAERDDPPARAELRLTVQGEAG